MDSSDAREHLEMVERIVAASSRKLEVSGEFFLVWGLASGTLDLIFQLVNDGRLPLATVWAGPLLIVAAVLYTAVRVRRFRAMPGARMTLLEREFLNVLWIALAMAFAVNLVGGHIFSQWAQAAIWSVAAAIALFYIAVHGNRRALVGGIVLLLSIAFANFSVPIAGYVLAGGMYLGYAGFGLADMLARE
ncbi:MAG: hypothetical protein KGN02_08365 [bacterium]|nr:hypothetical protein [bacterium]